MTPKLPTKKYSIIYADPPWSYYNDMTVTPEQNRSGIGSIKKLNYPVMSSDDIASLDVQAITNERAILFIWTTDYHLSKCISKVIPSWGFEYKTIGFVWQKLNKQGNPVSFMGAYTLKSGAELCLLATKGDARKLVREYNVKGLLQSPRLEHSKKPNEIRNRIEKLVGNVPKIELFARNKTIGWDVWGNEV